MNRNKRSLALDLETSRGRDALLQLAAHADVVVESFKPGVSDRLGIGYAEMKARKPRLVYCSVSAFGESESGRVRHQQALAALLQARLLAHGSQTWIERLQAASVPVAPVQDLAQAVAHPLLAERGMLCPSEGSPPGTAPLLRLPCDDARPPTLRRAPALGEHSREILSAAGFSEEDIAALLEDTEIRGQ